MANNTTTLSAELATYYVRTFLLNSNNKFVFDIGAQKRTIPAGNGTTIKFSRYQPLVPKITPLTEGESGSSTDLSCVNVNATVAEYGDYAKVTKLLSSSSIDLDAKAKIELFRDQMLATLDTLIRNELVASASTQVSASALAASDISKAVATLETKKAFKFADGYFLGIIGPKGKQALMNDSKWLAPHQYKDTVDIYKGEIGSFLGVRFLESSTIDDGATENINTFILGREAIGTVDLEKDKPKLYINGTQLVSGKKATFENGDKSDPLGRFCTIGWAGAFAAKVLNSDWVVRLQTKA